MMKWDEQLVGAGAMYAITENASGSITVHHTSCNECGFWPRKTPPKQEGYYVQYADSPELLAGPFQDLNEAKAAAIMILG